MKAHRVLLLCLLALLAALATAGAEPAPDWLAGRDYFVIGQPQPTRVAPGKIEVLEVFSYACPACNAYRPTIELLRKNLPANAQLAYLPAAFIPAEDWPMFQRAYFAAQALGIAERTHQQMYDAVWKSGELATTDSRTHALKSPQPTIEQAAQLYARWTGVKPADFLAMAQSFSIASKMSAADEQIGVMQALSTPTIVVNGRYRIAAMNQGADRLVPLVRFLVAKESSH
jgi:protein dithiol oxidoreductase (disulfide-forming)